MYDGLRVVVLTAVVGANGSRVASNSARRAESKRSIVRDPSIEIDSSQRPQSTAATPPASGCRPNHGASIETGVPSIARSSTNHRYRLRTHPSLTYVRTRHHHPPDRAARSRLCPWGAHSNPVECARRQSPPCSSLPRCSSRSPPRFFRRPGPSSGPPARVRTFL